MSFKESVTTDDFIEYMAHMNDAHVVSISSEEDTDEIQIIKELKAKVDDNHRCDLCCEGEFLVDKLLRFGGLINETYKFVCDKCDTSFVYKSELKKHLPQCPGPNSEPDKTVNSKNLRSRKQVPGVCTLCQTHFKSRGGLTKHMRIKHSNTTHKCEICQEVFSEFKKFNNHCIEHQKSMKNNMFGCSQCNKKFFSKVSLEKHLKKHKPDEIISLKDLFL